MVTIVAFCGAKESGKSTSAEIFRQLVNKATAEIAFAGHLKVVCSKVFNIEMKYFLDTKLKESELDNYVRLTKELAEKVFAEFEVKEYDFDKHIRPHMGQVFDTPRKLLQYVGTELLHPIDKLIHVNFALRKIDPNVITLVTDLRFPQEFDAVYGRPEFLPVYIDNKRAEDAAAADSHASERGWQQFKDRCYRLDNNGDLFNLEQSLKALIKEKL